jgi:hypothetical protein
MMTIGFLGNFAYGTVIIIVLYQVLDKGLKGAFTGVIMAGFPIAQIILTNRINDL